MAAVSSLGTARSPGGNAYALIEREIPKLRRYAMFLARNPEWADDLVQECLLRAINNIEKWQPGTNMRSWLMTILHNLFINEVKRRRPFLAGDEAVEDMRSAPGNQEARHHMRDVQRAFEQLNWQHRQIIWYICIEQMGYTDVADELGIPVGTVRSRLCRAREHLKRLLRKAQPGEAEEQRKAAADPASDAAG